MQKSRFCRQLAQLLAETPWHYRTLAAATILSTRNLPDSASEVLHQLLNQFPEQPGVRALESFLSNSPTVQWWFRMQHPPRIWRFSVQPADHPAPIDGLPEFYTVGELASWLCISPRTLNWLCDAWRIEDPRRPRHYRYMAFDKRHAGVRLLEAPKPRLKRAQRAILGAILSRASVSDCAMGYRRGVGCVDHARLHVGKQWVLSFDLENFFPSVTFPRVLGAFRSLGYPSSVAKTFALLCTHRCSPHDLAEFDLEKAQITALKQRHLAQGAPTSPALSNLVLRRLDRRLDGLARRLDCEYSRYADDIVFSGNTAHHWSHVEALVGSICLDEGFALNHRKTRIRSSAQQQRVTGVVVNEKLNVSRKEIDALKAELHNCARFGPDSQNRRGLSDYRAHLLGRIEYIRAINPVKGERLKEAFSRIGF